MKGRMIQQHMALKCKGTNEVIRYYRELMVLLNGRAQ